MMKECKIIESIINRHENEYYVEREIPQETDDKEYTSSYLSIIRSTFGNLFSGLFSRFSSFSISRPLIIHLAFLLIGIWLIQINTTLAIVAITILTGGFESWRRSQMETKRPPQ